MTTLKKAALAYAKRGWPVFPCRADKTPYAENGVLDATTDETVLASWWDRWPGANVALAVGDAGMLVLDYDPGSSAAEVEASLGEPPPVTHLSARTPRGGRHDYYLLPRGCVPFANSASKVAPNLDVRSFHGYVLLPPSLTANGIYEWIEEGKPALASEAMLAACRAAREKDPLRDEWLIEPDLFENVERAVAWLRGKARLAIEGSGGDNTTYATAAMLKSFGLSEARAMEILWEHWNPCCLPPWEYEDLAVKVTNAYCYNTSPPGNVTPAYHVARMALEFKPVLEALGDGKQAEAGRFRFVDRAGVETIKPPEWLLEDFLTEGGYGLLVGPRSSFKTFAALDAALTVATGGRAPWEEGTKWEGLWEAPDRPGAVLYVAGEGRPGLRQRIRAWEHYHRDGELAFDLILGDPVPRVAEGADALRQFIEGALRMREDGYRLVVFDTVGRSMQGVNENAQEYASAFTALVEHLQRELGATVLALHHTGHESSERGRGSSVFEADCDTIVVVARPGDGRHARLTMTKQKDAQEWGAVRWAEAKTVRLGLEEESLVVVRAEHVDAERAEAEAEGKHRLAFSVVDERALEVLRAHPLKEMNNSEFSRLVASWRPEGKETLGVTDQAVRKTWLPRLRSETCKSREHYDAGKDRWRYHPPAG